MKTLVLAAAALVSLSTTCLAQTPWMGGIDPKNSGRGETNPYIEDQLFELVNRYRTDKGLPAFKRDARLEEVARQNALRVMEKGYVDNVDYCVRQEEVVAIMPKLIRYGENNSFSFMKKENLAGEILQAWLGVERFQHNLINDYQTAGVVSVCNPNGEHFVVMNFAKVKIDPGKQEPSTQPASSTPAPASTPMQQPQQAENSEPEVEDIYGLSLN